MFLFQLDLLCATDSHFFGEAFVAGGALDTHDPDIFVVDRYKLDVFCACEEDKVEERH